MKIQEFLNNIVDYANAEGYFDIKKFDVTDKSEFESTIGYRAGEELASIVYELATPARSKNKQAEKYTFVYLGNEYSVQFLCGGYEDGGSEMEVLFSVKSENDIQYFILSGYYSSYDSSCLNFIHEAVPVEKTVIFYEKKR